MARLQILELPEGAGDDRAPFVLVIDEWQPSSDPDVDRDLSVQLEGAAARIGARGVLVFEVTVQIPANAPQILEEAVGGRRIPDFLSPIEGRVEVRPVRNG